MSSIHRSLAARILVLIAVLLLVAAVGAGWKWQRGNASAGLTWDDAVATSLAD